jgi:hypothetical protein
VEKLNQYREHARQCRELAQQMQHADQRKQLILMAETWEKLAEDRARAVRSK